MKTNKPARWHFILFVILSIVAIAQLSWWVIFQVGEGARITAYQQTIWDQQMILASERLNEPGDMTAADLNKWLAGTFPDLALSGDGELSVGADAKHRLDQLARKRVRMFVSEGAFFSLLLLGGVWFLYWTIKKKADLENSTAGILNLASSGMKNPIKSLQHDITLLEKNDMADQDRLKLVSGIKNNIFKISHACNHVSVIQSLSAGKRKISMSLVDIAEKTKAILSEFDSSFKELGFTIESDIAMDIKTVTNPERWTLIARSFLLMAARIDSKNQVLKIGLQKIDGQARLTVARENIVDVKRIITEQIEPELSNLNSLAALLGGRTMLYKTSDPDRLALTLETPLFAEENI